VDYVVCDFVCPTEQYRKVFDADITVWLDTIQEGRFDDTNKLFVPPSDYTYRIKDWNENQTIINLISQNSSKDSHKRSILKAISWRALGTLDTFVLSWLITGELKLAAAIGGTEVFTKMFLYYIHERLWTRIKLV
jgi:uncharacterized membrane protein